MNNNILSNKKIIYLIKTMDVGGSERFTLNLCKHFVNKFQNVTVFSSGGIFKEALLKMKIEHIDSNYAMLKSFIYFFHLRKELKIVFNDNHYDIIHCQHRIFVIILKTLHLRKTKIIYTANNYFDDIYQYFLFPDIATAISRSIQRNLESTTLIRKNRIRLINYGIETSNIPNNSLNIKTLGFVGRLMKEKGILQLFEAFKIIYSTDNSVKLIYRGKGKDSFLLKRLIIKNNLGISVIIEEPSNNLEVVYKGIDILILPSNMNEGLPLSLLEAISRNIIVVATNVGAIKDLIINQKTGIMLDSSAPEEIADKLKIILHNPNMVVSIRKDAKDYIRNNYDINKMYFKYEELYIQLLLA